MQHIYYRCTSVTAYILRYCCKCLMYCGGVFADVKHVRCIQQRPRSVVVGRILAVRCTRNITYPLAPSIRRAAQRTATPRTSEEAAAIPVGCMPVHVCSLQPRCPLKASLSGPRSRPWRLKKKKRKTTHEIPPNPKHTLLKMQFLAMETPFAHPRPRQHQKAVGPTSQVPNPQSSRAPPRRDRGGRNTCLYIPLAYV